MMAHLVNSDSGKRCANNKPFAHPTLAGNGSGQRGNNQSQNEMAKAAANSNNLNQSEREVFHRNISNQKYNYMELEDIARGVKDGSIR